MGWLFCLFILSASANVNYEGFSTVEPSDDKIKLVWDATARIRNIGNFDKIDKSTGDIQTVASSFEGAGVLIQKLNSTNALVLSNAHVVSCPPAKKCRLQVSFTINGSRLSANNSRLIQEALTKDIALIEINMSEENLAKIPVAPMASVHKILEDQRVFAIGYPQISLRKKSEWQTQVPENYNSKLKRISSGQRIKLLPYISAPEYQYIDGRTFHVQVGPILIHSADTLSGNSGGPLVNANGEVIGLSSGIQFGSNPKHNRYCFISGSDSSENLGCSYFAISSNAIATNFGLALR